MMALSDLYSDRKTTTNLRTEFLNPLLVCFQIVCATLNSVTTHKHLIFQPKFHSSYGESTFGLINKSQVHMRVGGTGSLFQKDTCQYSVSKQLHYWFLSPNWPQSDHNKGEYILANKLQDVHLTDLTETSPKSGNWVGKETSKDQHTTSPQTVEVSQSDKVARPPQPHRCKVSK
jgi:hypothetical protein